MAIIRYNCIGHTPAPEGKPVYRAWRTEDGLNGATLGYAHTVNELLANIAPFYPGAESRMVSPAQARESEQRMAEYQEFQRMAVMRQKIMLAVKAGQPAAAMKAGVPAVTGELWLTLAFMSESALKGVCRELNITV